MTSIGSWVFALAALASTGGLPEYPSARKLCSERVYAKTMEIHWRTWATTDTVDKVVAFYTQARGEKPTRDESGGWTWQEAGKPDHHLTIYAAGKPGYPSCETKPNASERTVIMDSVAYRH